MSGLASPACNPARGEVVATVAGAPRRLCLTLGALAEMEGALGAQGWAALAERLRSLRSGDLLAVLAALLRGGGDPAELAAAASPAEAAAAIAAAFAAAVPAG